MAEEVDRALASAQWPVGLSVLVALVGVAVDLLAFREADVYLGAIGSACGVAGLVLVAGERAPGKRLLLLGALGSLAAGLLGLAALLAFK